MSRWDTLCFFLGLKNSLLVPLLLRNRILDLVLKVSFFNFVHLVPGSNIRCKRGEKYPFSGYLTRGQKPSKLGLFLKVS